MLLKKSWSWWNGDEDDGGKFNKHDWIHNTGCRFSVSFMNKINKSQCISDGNFSIEIRINEKGKRNKNHPTKGLPVEKLCLYMIFSCVLATQ